MFESSSSDDNSVSLLEGMSAEVAMKETEYEELLRLREENEALKKEKQQMAIILARYEKTLDIFEKEKNGLEDKLYSKFLPVLNAKKEEILRLQTLLKCSRAEPDVDYGEDEDTDVDEEEVAGGCENKRQKQ